MPERSSGNVALGRRAVASAATLLIAVALAACAQSRSGPTGLSSQPTASAAPGAMGDMGATPAAHATAALSPIPDAAEAKFIAAAAAHLQARFPNAASAQAAHYVRYTDEDPFGIITYTDQRWFDDDPQHPTQLWYDAHGRLIGADYTMAVRDRAHRPDIWGLQPGRWVHFIAHMHYAVREPDGSIRYGSLLDPTYRANGGDPVHPTAAPLVRLGIAKRESDVLLVFQLPEIWIASVWLVPNPNGAFADSNPLVKPTSGKQTPAHPS